MLDYDATTGEYLVCFFWKDPNHLGQGATTDVVTANDLSPLPNYA